MSEEAYAMGSDDDEELPDPSSSNRDNRGTR